MKLVVDAYAWMELFQGSPKGRGVKDALEKAEEIYTPDTVLAELSRKYLRDGVPEKTVRERLAVVLGTSEIVPVTPSLAVSASRAYLELAEQAKRKKLNQPSLFDGIVLGAARLKEAKVLTDDRHFRGLPETVWV